MTSDQQGTVPEADAGTDKTAASRQNGRFNALDILARLPDLSRDQPASYSRSSRRHHRRPREVSLRVLGGSVVGLFLLAIVGSYFWSGPGEDAALPSEAAASLDVDSAVKSSTKETESDGPKVVPIADIDASSKPAATSAGPLEPSEFEKALGVVKTEPAPEDASVAAIQPFVVGEPDAAEPSTPMNGNSTPTRPLAPRFEETPGSLADARNGALGQLNPGSAPRSPYAAPQAPAESTNFTPWQPNMAATQEPAYPGPSQPQPRSDAGPSYSPWSAATGPAPSAPAPERREPAYTAMNPNPPGAPSAAPSGPAYRNPPPSHRPMNANPPYAPAAAPGAPAYESPSPVWSPGNPYAAPNSAPRDVSPTQNPYQQ